MASLTYEDANTWRRSLIELLQERDHLASENAILWMVCGYLDPVGAGPDPQWMFFALAEDALGGLDDIKKLTLKSVSEKAFGPCD